VKSCWVKALVEANVPKEIKLDGLKFVEVVKDWAQSHAVDNSVKSAATAATRRSNDSVKSSPQVRSNDNSTRSSRR
jgi:hypothetical protein